MTILCIVQCRIFWIWYIIEVKCLLDCSKFLFFVEMYQVFGSRLCFPDEVNYKIDETYCFTYFGLNWSDLNPWTAVALPFPSNTLHSHTLCKQCLLCKTPTDPPCDEKRAPCYLQVLKKSFNHFFASSVFSRLFSLPHAVTVQVPKRKFHL